MQSAAALKALEEANSKITWERAQTQTEEALTDC